MSAILQMSNSIIKTDKCFRILAVLRVSRNSKGRGLMSYKTKSACMSDLTMALFNSWQVVSYPHQHRKISTSKTLECLPKAWKHLSSTMKVVTKPIIKAKLSLCKTRCSTKSEHSLPLESKTIATWPTTLKNVTKAQATLPKERHRDGQPRKHKTLPIITS